MPEPHDAAAHDQSARDLVAHARETRVVVIGGGLAGAVAALECAKVGMSVTLLEAGEAIGVRRIDLAGIALDAYGDDFDRDAGAASRGAADEDAGGWAALLTDLGLEDRIEDVAASALWIGGAATRNGDAVPVPSDAVLGIPANPWDAGVRRVIGWRGAWRAYVDRLRPPLTIGRERNLGALVRARMGDRVCDRLVAPVTRALHGLEPHDVDVEAAVPGLSAALTRTGSLAGAVASLADDRPGRATVAGGLGVVSDALSRRLDDFGVEVRTRTRAEALVRLPDGGWTVTVDAAAAGDVPALPGADAGTADLEADVVVLAVPEAAARRLLGGLAQLPPAQPAGEVAGQTLDVVTLRVRMPAPQRSDVAPIDPSLSGGAWRVSDLTASRAWISAALPPGERIVRVVRPTPDAGGETADAAATAWARGAASDALGHDIAAADVVAAAMTRVTATPAVRLGHDDRRRAARAALRVAEGLAVTGAWLAGDDPAAIVADAITETARVRRTVLWGGGETTSF